MKHTVQEEKGGLTCQGFLSLHKLYAPVENAGRELCKTCGRVLQLNDLWITNKNNYSASGGACLATSRSDKYARLLARKEKKKKYAFNQF